jgi:FkbM family methyltransferase
MGGVKSFLYKVIKKVGLTNSFLKLNFLIKRQFGIRHKDFFRLKGFYKQFIQPNALVFDIGTNVGNRSDVFLALGAKTICIEPNKKLVEVLKFKFAKNKNAVIVNAACGARNEMKEFKIANNHRVSTFSRKFIEHKNNRGHNAKWVQTEMVEVNSLDYLVNQFGRPDFCKIDVEGYEKEVIQGLNSKIGIISFEFTSPTFNEDSIWCLRKLASLEYSYFNISFKESLEFIDEKWISADELITFISTNEKMKTSSYGDIYAK